MRAIIHVVARYAMVSRSDVVVVGSGSGNVEGDENGLKKRQDDDCDKHEVCMKGEELVVLVR